MRHGSLNTAGGSGLEGELRIGDREIHVWTIRLQASAQARAELLSVQSASEQARLWTLHHLEPEPGWVGTLAYRSAPRLLTSFDAGRADDLLHPLRQIPVALAAALGAGRPAARPHG